jgi:hypothetical protein
MRASARVMFSAEFAYERRMYPSPLTPKSGPPIVATPASSSSAEASAFAFQPVSRMLGKA